MLRTISVVSALAVTTLWTVLNVADANATAAPGAITAKLEYYLGANQPVPKAILAAGIQAPLYNTGSSVVSALGEGQSCSAVAANSYKCSAGGELDDDTRNCSARIAAGPGMKCSSGEGPGTGNTAKCSASSELGGYTGLVCCSVTGTSGTPASNAECSVWGDTGLGEKTCSAYTETGGDNKAFCSALSNPSNSTCTAATGGTGQCSTDGGAQSNCSVKENSGSSSCTAEADTNGSCSSKAGTGENTSCSTHSSGGNFLSGPDENGRCGS